MTTQDDIRQLMTEMGQEQGIDQAGTEDVAIDAAIRAIGPVAAQFLGQPGAVRMQGVDTEVPRLSSVHPASTGAGILLRLAGVGAVNPVSSLFGLGRIAVNDDDFFDIFLAQNTTEGTWANQASGSYTHPKLKVNVPCAANVSTLLAGIAFVEVRPGVQTSKAYGRIVLGGEEFGSATKGTRNTNGSLGIETPHMGGDSLQLLPMIPHVRVVTPAGNPGASVEVPCSARLRTSPYQTKNNRIGTAWLAVLRVPA